MSIFPKRSVPGGTVTIHWNFNTAHLTDVHICPWVRIGVKDPKGEVAMLFEDHVLGLPDPKDQAQDQDLPAPTLKYLHKNLPLMIMADYLSGRHKREKLVEILQNIQSGRHYYFTYHVAEDAPLGKYTLISEVHSGGETRYSKTAPDDFFLIEKVSFKCTNESGGKKNAVIVNHSPEKTPVKIVGCMPTVDGKMQTSVNVFEMEGLEEKSVSLTARLNFLLYNEERKVVPLQEGSPDYLLRNQQVLELNKNDGSTYLLRKDKEEGYQFTKQTKALWLRSDGLLNKCQLSDEELEAYKALKADGLITDIRF